MAYIKKNNEPIFWIFKYQVDFLLKDDYTFKDKYTNAVVDPSLLWGQRGAFGAFEKVDTIYLSDLVSDVVISDEYYGSGSLNISLSAYDNLEGGKPYDKKGLKKSKWVKYLISQLEPEGYSYMLVTTFGGSGDKNTPLLDSDNEYIKHTNIPENFCPMFAGAVDKMSPSDDGYVIDITCCDYKAIMSETPILSGNHHYSSAMSGKDRSGIMENDILPDSKLNGGNTKDENFSYEANLSMLTMGSGVKAEYNKALNGGPAFNEGYEYKYDIGNMNEVSGSDYQFLDVTRKPAFSGKYAFDSGWEKSDIIPLGRIDKGTFKIINTHSHPKLRGLQSNVVQLPNRYPYPKVHTFRTVKGESTMIEFLRELDIATQVPNNTQVKPTSVKTLDVRLIKAPMVYGTTTVGDCLCNELYIFRLNDSRVPKTHKQVYESILDTNYNYDRLGSNYYDVGYATCGIEPYTDDNEVLQGYQEWTMSGRLDKPADTPAYSRYDIIPKTFISRVSAPDDIELEDGTVEVIDKAEYLKGELKNALSSTSSDLSLDVVLPSDIDGTYCLGDLIEVSIKDMDRDYEMFYIKGYNYTINPNTSSGEWSYTIEKFTGGYL